MKNDIDELAGWKELAIPRCENCGWWIRFSMLIGGKVTFHRCAMIDEDGHKATTEGAFLYTLDDFYCNEWKAKG